MLKSGLFDLYMPLSGRKVHGGLPVKLFEYMAGGLPVPFRKRLSKVIPNVLAENMLEKYTWETEGKKLLEVYEKVISD